ncbi:6477_t:CDS:2, partial [Racocetra persica]
DMREIRAIEKHIEDKKKGKVKYYTNKALEDLSKLDEKTQKKIKKRVENHLATHPTQNVYKIKKKGEGKIVVVVEVGERNARQKESIYNREPPRPTSKNQRQERTLKEVEKAVNKILNADPTDREALEL